MCVFFQYFISVIDFVAHRIILNMFLQLWRWWIWYFIEVNNYLFKFQTSVPVSLRRYIYLCLSNHMKKFPPCADFTYLCFTLEQTINQRFISYLRRYRECNPNSVRVSPGCDIWRSSQSPRPRNVFHKPLIWAPQI